ncbi:MAG TPA: 23S rRNA (pseudouridine(1915)-N(3))-methyltransferase RlmH [Chitinophagaceae bacterium]|nr:23S rRNA (pseudouridine(1915)-N(3))-methyltransferase RlmH [Chitinophagaceae bacterium]
MKIQLWSIGQGTDAHFDGAVDLYARRLNHYTEFSSWTLPEVKGGHLLPVQELKKREAEKFRKKMDTRDFLISLDEHGIQMDSLGFSVFLDKKIQAGQKSIVFIVGGAYGLDESLIRESGLVLSLSPFTFPHQMARLILTEQLYRAFTLMRNEKYHHQ